ncbi:MAG: DUF1572 family protein [Candidatus Omnitrophica bacterium]|nr:DUF1572 family protein [Candidatus Omnitrophota bacterium]
MTPFLESLLFRFEAVKNLGDRTFRQMASDEAFRWTPDSESNCIGVLIQHLHGNMLSRWTDFLTSDGNKEWRDRDGEFTFRPERTREDYLRLWEEGWRVTLNTIGGLKNEDLEKEVTVRGQPLTVIDALHRQLSHYSYHVGQIVVLAKIQKLADWQTLSIPKGKSKDYVPTKQD